MNVRQVWVDRLIKIAHPVIYHLAEDTLKLNMPMKKHADAEDRAYCTYLEAVGRTLCGFSAWFEASRLDEDEEKQRAYYLELTIKGLKNAFDENAADFLYTKKDENYLYQVLVDTAFLALGLMRAKRSLWDRLDQDTQMRIVRYFKETRAIQPWFNNWLLFSCMVEAFFHAVGEPCDMMRIDYGIKQMEQWYTGDGLYKDGKAYHADYYNSFVIQPFLMSILEEVGTDYRDYHTYYPVMRMRAQRYAKIQEMSINTDGTFCAVGRSIVYRCGAFQHLAQMALTKTLHEDLSEAGVRCALTAMIKKCIDAPNTFDEAGWLNIGLCGKQPDLGESYISIGSLYLCTLAFLPLGLDADDHFWIDADELYTMQKIWSGMNVPADHALY